MLLKNGAEGGTNGTTVTTGNSGGASGDAFTTVTGVPTFSNAQAAHGSLGYAILAAQGVVWSFTAAATVSARSYVLFTAAPTASVGLIVMQDGSGTLAGKVIAYDAGSGVIKVALLDANSSGSAASTTTLALNTQYRIELQVVGHATTGSVTARIYAGDSTTVLETMSLTGTNTLGNMSRILFGGILNMYADDIGVTDTGWMGPAVTTLTAVAGAAQSVTTGGTVTVGGTDIAGPNPITSRAWTQVSPASPSGAFTTASAQTSVWTAPTGVMSATNYTLRKTISDGTTTSTSDVVVTVNPAGSAGTPIPIPVLGASTGAAANTLTLTATVPSGHAVAAGSSVIVKVGERHLGGVPATPVVTDSRGNTYTRINYGGTSAANESTHLCAPLTTGLSVGDTVTVTYATNNCDEIVMVIDAVPAVTLAADGSVMTPTALGSSLTHTISVSAPTASDLLHGADLYSGASASYSGVSGATFLQVASSTNRALVSYYSNPASTAAQNPTVTWTGTAHTGSMDFIAYSVTSGNNPPTANAGPDQTHAVNKLVTMAFSGTDTDGTVVAYTSRIITKPTGSTAALSSTTGTTPTITPDVAGAYVIGLIVTDNLGALSGERSMTLTAVAPGANAGAGATLNIAEVDPQLVATITGVGVTGTWVQGITGTPNPATVTIAAPTSPSTTIKRPTIPGAYRYHYDGTDEAGTAFTGTTQTLVFGGVVVGANPVEVYDPITGTWV